MSLILSLDTSSTSCTVALHEAGRLLGFSGLYTEHAHAAKLAPLIAQLLANTDRASTDLVAIAVASGPGSYTGLRIGTSTAKGLCYSLNVPLLAVDSLTVMAAKALPVVGPDALLCPMLDARRMEVYFSVLDASLRAVQPIQPLVFEEGVFATLLQKQRIAFFGNGYSKGKAFLKHPNAVFVEDIYPSAADLGLLAWKKWQNQEFVDLEQFEPIYLKEFLIKKSTKIDTLLNK